MFELMLPFRNTSNKRSRVEIEAKCLLVKDIILEHLHVDNLRVEAVEWSTEDYIAIESRIKAIQKFLEAQEKGDSSPEREEVEEADKSATTESIAIYSLQPSVSTNKTNDSVFPVETLRQVSMSGFLSTEELGRFLLCTCKTFHDALSEEFISKVVCFNSSSERLNHVPRSILTAHGPQWVFDEIMEGVTASLMEESTTLNVDNLTISLKLLHKKTEIYSHILAGTDLKNFLEDGSVTIELFQDSHEQLFENDAMALSATMHGFREDTNQVVRLLDCDGILTKDTNVLFPGQNFGFLCMEVRIAFDDDDCDAIMTVRNVYDPNYDNTEDKSDCNYNFFRALHHFTPWKG